MGKNYGKWGWIQQGMPSIPIYEPKESYKKFKMTFGGVVPMSYVNKVLKLWSTKHWPSRL